MVAIIITLTVCGTLSFGFLLIYKWESSRPEANCTHDPEFIREFKYTYERGYGSKWTDTIMVSKCKKCGQIKKTVV